MDFKTIGCVGPTKLFKIFQGKNPESVSVNAKFGYINISRIEHLGNVVLRICGHWGFWDISRFETLKFETWKLRNLEFWNFHVLEL